MLEPRFKHKCLENFRWKECYDEKGVRQEIPDEPMQGPAQFRWINSWWNAKYPLCALCLHPIGYYGDTWAGVMCPTDEVIAHLLMMRGSEEKIWANSNQHPVDHPNAGV